MPCGEKLMSHRPVDGRDTASRRRITIAEMHTPPRCGWGSSDRRWRAGWSSTRSTAMDYGGDADRHEVGRRRVNGAMWLPAEFTFVVGAHALRRVTHTHRYIRRWRGGRDVRAAAQSRSSAEGTVSRRAAPTSGQNHVIAITWSQRYAEAAVAE